MTDNRQSVAGAYAKIEAHEDQCAIRYDGIKDTLTEVKTDIRLMMKGLAAVLIAVLGWLAIQVYNGVKSPAQAHVLPVEGKR